MDTDKVGVEPMLGAMAEADFEANTITFDMRGDYFAAVGLYAIVPQAEYERMLRIYRAKCLQREIDKRTTDHGGGDG